MQVDRFAKGCLDLPLNTDMLKNWLTVFVQLDDFFKIGRDFMHIRTGLFIDGLFVDIDLREFIGEDIAQDGRGKTPLAQYLLRVRKSVVQGKGGCVSVYHG